MENVTEEQIRARAHKLWEQAGKPEGRDDEFWHLAEQELRNEDRSSPLRTPDNLQALIDGAAVMMRGTFGSSAGLRSRI
jgi:hypothetical protein